MTIETLVNLVEGELLNTPFISKITGISSDAEEVQRGYLFIAKDIEEIPKAIQNGAYAILLNKKTEIIDPEIAWIKIFNFQEALIKLAKYYSLNKEIYFCDAVTLDLISSMNKNKHIKTLKGSLEQQIETFLSHKDKILVTSLEDLKNIFAKYKTIYKEDLTIIDGESFDIYVYWKERKHHLKIPYIYKENLQKAIWFFKDTNSNFSIDNAYLDRLEITYINGYFQKVERGKSNKVILNFKVDKNEILMKEFNYLFNHLKHGKVLFFDETNLDELYTSEFNFAIIFAQNFELKSKQLKLKSLF